MTTFTRTYNIRRAKLRQRKEEPETQNNTTQPRHSTCILTASLQICCAFLRNVNSWQMQRGLLRQASTLLSSLLAFQVLLSHCRVKWAEACHETMRHLVTRHSTTVTTNTTVLCELQMHELSENADYYLKYFPDSYLRLRVQGTKREAIDELWPSEGSIETSPVHRWS